MHNLAGKPSVAQLNVNHLPGNKTEKSVCFLHFLHFSEKCSCCCSGNHIRWPIPSNPSYN